MSDDYDDLVLDLLRKIEGDLAGLHLMLAEQGPCLSRIEAIIAGIQHDRLKRLGLVEV